MTQDTDFRQVGEGESGVDETQVLSPVPDPRPPNSVLAALQARRREHAEKRTYDLEVPGYRGLLVLRLGPIPAKQLSTITDRAVSSRSPEAAFNANADTLLAACRFVLGRAKASDELTVLEDEEGEPLRIGEQLAELLHLEKGSARTVLRSMFEGANSPDMAVVSAAAEYSEWASSANDELDEELLGE